MKLTNKNSCSACHQRLYRVTQNHTNDGFYYVAHESTTNLYHVVLNKSKESI